MTFELTVVLINTRDNLNNSWNFSMNAALSPIEMIYGYFLSSVGNCIESNIFLRFWLVYEYMRIWLLKRKFVNIKFVSSVKFYFVCCKALSVLIKTKWYCQVESLPFRFWNNIQFLAYRPHAWLDLLSSIVPGVIAMRWRDDNWQVRVTNRIESIKIYLLYLLTS